jgi:hypothetical protein
VPGSPPATQLHEFVAEFVDWVAIDQPSITSRAFVCRQTVHPARQPRNPQAVIEGLEPTVSRVLAKVRRGAITAPSKADAARSRLSCPPVRTGVLTCRVVLREGRKHIGRRMMDEVGHLVLCLIRMAAGPIRLGRPAPRRLPPPLQRREDRPLFKTVGD